MPTIGPLVAMLALLAIALLAFMLVAVYFRATGEEAARRNRVREAVVAQRRARKRAPILAQTEVPEDPSELLRSQGPWWRRLRR